MKIESWEELEYTYELLAKMVRQRDRSAQEPAWTPSQRATAVEGIEAQMRKMERDVQEFLSTHSESEKIPQPV